MLAHLCLFNSFPNYCLKYLTSKRIFKGLFFQSLFNFQGAFVLSFSDNVYEVYHKLIRLSTLFSNFFEFLFLRNSVKFFRSRERALPLYQTVFRLSSLFQNFFKLFSVRFSGAAALADSFAIITLFNRYVNTFSAYFWAKNTSC